MLVCHHSRRIRFIRRLVATLCVAPLLLPNILVAQTDSDSANEAKADAQETSSTDTTNASPANTVDPTAQAAFDEAISLRADLKYDEAITILKRVIADYAHSSATVREAYNHLVATYYFGDDDDAATTAAKEALLTYPDLTANEATFPDEVNLIYSVLRQSLYGSLTIRALHEDEEIRNALVLIDGLENGRTPATLPYIRVGDHEVKITTEGYKDQTEQITIEGGQTLARDIPMEKGKGWTWWVLRGGVVVAVLAAVGVAASSGDSSAPPDDPPDPLPEPPPPPTN